MRAPKRRRPLPRTILGQLPEGTDCFHLASRVSYVGSPEHKSGPSFAGAPRPRADATICDAAFSARLDDIQGWLRRGLELECVGGPWEDDFPRYIWCKVGEVVFEARLVNRVRGQYKGWQLIREEWPARIDEFQWPE